MKKSLRTIALILALILMMSVLVTGCQPTNTTAPTTAPTGEVKTKLPAGTKIGMTILVNDGLFATMAQYIQYIADNIGFELVLDVGAFSPEDQVASVENLIAAGCQGIVFCNFSEAVLPKIATVCDEAEVYWAQYCRQVDNQEIVASLNNSKYYVGRCYENNANVAVRVVKAFEELNVKKTAIIGPATGDTTTDTVSAKFKSLCQEKGIEVYTEIRNAQEAADCTAAAETIVSNFPDVEGIIVLSGSTGKLEGVFKGLENVGKLGKIKVGALDASVNIVEDLKKGSIVCANSGQFVDNMFTTMLVLNAVLGTPLKTDGKATIECEYVAFYKAADAEFYFANMENLKDKVFAYNIDEVRKMVKYFNPAFTYDDLQAIATAYSTEDVKTRHNIT
ncbi:MAG TPA: hypothetical protein DCM45_02845 [Clostridiales bacterium]|nr:hypothetical protein [Clostridiales bacterium]